MPSERQVKASRQNGALSHGPVTPEGKARSSRNAVKHGLTAKYHVIADEDQQEFNQLLNAFLHDHQPEGQTELDLVQAMAVASWRLRRVRAMETGLFNRGLAEAKDRLKRAFDRLQPHERKACVFSYDTDEFATLARYEGRIERSFYRALHELQRLQAARSGRRVPPPQVVEVNQPEPDELAAPQPRPGFVLSNSSHDSSPPELIQDEALPPSCPAAGQEAPRLGVRRASPHRPAPPVDCNVK
jgi:hypothetical protein